MRPGEGGPGNGADQYRGSTPGDRPPYGNSEFGGPAGAPFGGPGSFPPGGVAPEVVADSPAVRQGRPGLIVLIAFIVQLVIVAAVGNQWVTDKLVDYRADHRGLGGVFVTTPLAFSWRFTPRDGDRFHIWGAQLAGLGAGLVLAALLTLALVRGAVTFGRAFFGVWMSVIVATLLGSMVFRAVVDRGYLGDTPGLGDGGKERVFTILYRGGGIEIPAGIGLGFVVALIAALVAVVSRRKVAVAVPLAATQPPPAPEPETPPPYYGENGPSAAPGSESRTMSMQKVQDSTSGPPDQRGPDQRVARNDEAFRRPDESSMTTPIAAGAAGAGLAGVAAAGSRDDSQDDDQRSDAARSDSQRSEDSSATQALPVQGAQRDATPEPAPEPTHEPEPAREPIPEPVPEPSPTSEPIAEPAAEPQATQAMPVQQPEHQPDQPSADGGSTQAFPMQNSPVGNSDEQTVRRSDLPHFPPPGASDQGEPNPTQQFPRPPDDEDMGQHPDHHHD